MKFLHTRTKASLLWAFELTDVLQAVQWIAGKPANRLGNNHVDVPGHAFVNHAVELRALFRIGAGDAIVRKDASQHPIRMILNVLDVVFHLSFVTCSLLIAVSTASKSPFRTRERTTFGHWSPNL